MAERHVVRFQFRRIEVVDRDDACDEALDLAKLLGLGRRDDAFGFGVGKPIDAVIAAYDPIADRLFEFLRPARPRSLSRA